MKEKKNSIYLIIGIVTLILFTSYITYAYFKSDISTSIKDLLVQTDPAISFSSNISKQISFSTDAENMLSSNIGWNVTDTSVVTINLSGPEGTFCYYDLVYTKEGDRYEPLTSNNGGGLTMWTSSSADTSSGGIAEGTTFNYPTKTDYASVDETLVKGKITITSGSSTSYTIDVNLNYENLNTSQKANAGKQFDGVLEVKNIDCGGEKDTLMDLMLKNVYGVDNVNDAKTLISQKAAPDFNTIATTNEGIFKTVDDDGDVYYYRGSVDNNHVIFGNFCWKIVRTTGTGGVKLIYDGVPTSGVCNNTGDNTQIGTSEFNTSGDNAAYVGYMYGDINSSSLDENGKFKNTYDSTAKTAVDNWFRNNLLDDYSSYLEDTIFCNDRSVSSTSGSDVYFGAYDRLKTNKSPSLICPQANDKFTVSSSRGNGALTYPVGLLTADEMAMAGGKYNTDNSSYYLYNGQYQWSLSPYYGGNLGAYAWSMYSTGILVTYSGVNYSFGLRPVVSLKPGTLVSGGNGTSNTPYIIE